MVGHLGNRGFLVLQIGKNVHFILAVLAIGGVFRIPLPSWPQRYWWGDNCFIVRVQESVLKVLC